MENLERNPKVVPTGQTSLHQVLPPIHARTVTTTKVAAATRRVGRLFSHTSRGYTL